LAPGCTETDIDKQVFDLAAADFGTRKHWHQRLPRVGQNTIHPIYDKVADVALQEDDIVYVDLGPVFGDMEADFGRTYVLGEPQMTYCPHISPHQLLLVH
jgi:Xaa-Pro dipeptidase